VRTSHSIQLRLQQLFERVLRKTAVSKQQIARSMEILPQHPGKFYIRANESKGAGGNLRSSPSPCGSSGVASTRSMAISSAVRPLLRENITHELKC